METIQQNPAGLYNCDEISITIVQQKRMKILGLKGKRLISSLQSAEQGSLVKVVTCISIDTSFLHYLYFQEMMNGTLPGSIHACNPSGWIQSKIFFSCGFLILSNTQS
jgi:hypothetical protein